MVKISTDKKFVKPSTGHERYGFYINQWLKENLDKYFIEGVKHKWDGVAIVSGMEGSGKSTMAAMLAHYCDPTFYFGDCLDRVAFTFDQFMAAIDNSKPGQAIVLDEAILLFLAQDASSRLQKILQKKITLIRKKRLFIFIVIPSFFLIRMYLAVLRSRFLLHAYTPDGVRRGYFKFYSYDTKRKLYFAGKKFMDMAASKEDFRGDFVDTNGFFFDVNEYERKKDDAIRHLTEEADGKKNVMKGQALKMKIQRNRLILHLYNQQKLMDDDPEKYRIEDFKDYMYRLGFDLTNEGFRKIIREAEEQERAESKGYPTNKTPHVADSG